MKNEKKFKRIKLGCFRKKHVIKHILAIAYINNL